MSHATGLFASLRGFAATSVALLRIRLELLTIEAREEAGRVSGLLLWGMASVLLGSVGIAFLAVFLTVLFWESHRLLVLGIFSALFLCAAAVATGIALQLARRGSQLFSASLAELRQDEKVLRGERSA